MRHVRAVKQELVIWTDKVRLSEPDDPIQDYGMELLASSRKARAGNSLGPLLLIFRGSEDFTQHQTDTVKIFA
jgi:hypothetical protein